VLFLFFKWLFFSYLYTLYNELFVDESLSSSSSFSSSLISKEATKTFNINNNIYVCEEERLTKCRQALKMFSDEMFSNKLAEHLSRGVIKEGEKKQISEVVIKDGEIRKIIFFAEHTVQCGVVYNFTMDCSTEILICSFVDQSTKVWEIRLNQKVGGMSSPLSPATLEKYPVHVLSLINSAVDILMITCFYSSLHLPLTFELKRYIIFNYQKTPEDKSIKTFLLNAKWIEVDKLFKSNNKIGQVAKVGDLVFSIPTQFFTL